jgi:uncharacterized protein YijF (DUF1287 family)
MKSASRNLKRAKSSHLTLLGILYRAPISDVFIELPLRSSVGVERPRALLFSLPAEIKMKGVKIVGRVGLFCALSVLACPSCTWLNGRTRAVQVEPRVLTEAQRVRADAPPLERVTAGAVEQTTQTKIYDSSYVKLDYPNGDVPIDRGVCADVIIRAFRKGGVDLQKELHEDMKSNFAKYPQKWGAKRADRNIDHRRVPNLMTWFERQKKSLPLSREDREYQPGDVVAWELDNGLMHIGMVSGIKVEGTGRYAVIHNIGSGAHPEDVLFAWKIIGHYRYF